MYRTRTLKDKHHIKIREYVKNHGLSEYDANNLSDKCKIILTRDNIYNLICNDKLNIKEVIQLLSDNTIEMKYGLAENNNFFMTRRSFNALLDVLSNKDIYELMKLEKITIKQILSFFPIVLMNLAKNNNLVNLLSKGIITFDILCSNMTSILANDDFSKFLLENKLTLDQLEGVYIAHKEKMIESEIASVCRLLTDNILTYEHACSLTHHAFKALQNEKVFKLLENNNLSLNQVLDLSFPASLAIRDTNVLTMIDSNILTIDNCLGLSYAACMALRNNTVCALINAGDLTVAQVLGITEVASSALRNGEVLALMDDQIITTEQVLRLTEAAYNALRDAEIRQQLFNREINIDHILNPPAEVQGSDNSRINDPQSSHTASINRSVSLAAKKLFDNYKVEIEGEKLDSVINNIEKYLHGLPFCYTNLVAIRCFNRISSLDYTHEDAVSGVSTRQLLALVFLAISDDDRRTASAEDAGACFVGALYEIHRGYNLSEDGVDNGGIDISICSSGTFNKLIEKLQGIYPDCEIQFISKTTAAFKLMAIVHEETVNYLNCFASPETSDELVSLTNLIAQLNEDECVEEIWDHIKNNVETRMFDEFGCLFNNKKDDSFKGFVDQGQYASAGDLSILQKKVQNSVGYQKYCSQMLRKSHHIFCNSLQEELQHETSNIKVMKK